MSDKKKGDEILNKDQLTKEVDSSIHGEKNIDSNNLLQNAEREKLINRLIAKQVICQGRMCGTFRDGMKEAYSVMRKSLLCIILAIILLVPALSFAAGSGVKPRTEKSGKYEYLFNKDKKTVTFLGYGDSRERMSIESFIVPETLDGHKVTGIREYAFSMWRSLKDLTLPGTITYIGEYAFNNCLSLSYLVVPEGVNEIAANAFSVSGLKKVVLPSSLKKIDKKAFEGCNLENVIVVKGSNAEKFCKQNNLPYSYEDLVASSEAEKAEGADSLTENQQGWFDYGTGALLPKPRLQSGEEPEYDRERLINSENGFAVIVTNASIADLDAYVGLLVDFGYSIEERSDIHIKAINDEGYEVFSMFGESIGLDISCMAPVSSAAIDTADSNPTKVENALSQKDSWICPNCGNDAVGNFCNNCGTARPSDEWICPNCGNQATGNFCSNCGAGKTTKAPAVQSETVIVKLSSGREVSVRKSIKEALDAYETLMEGYKDAITKMTNGDYSGYMAFWEKYMDMCDKIEKMEEDFTDDEALYYLEVSTKVLQKMY